MFVFAKAREITRTNHFHKYRCYHTCDNASMKLIMVWFVQTKFCKHAEYDDSHFQYRSNKNQFQNDYDGRKTLSVEIK